jgi:hypothetical protein
MLTTGVILKLADANYEMIIWEKPQIVKRYSKTFIKNGQSADWPL